MKENYRDYTVDYIGNISHIPNGDYMVEVFGWIMCRNIGSGKYRICVKEIPGIYGRKRQIAVFYKPNGKKEIARHYIENIMLVESGSARDTDNNKTRILYKIEKEGN